MKKYHLMLTSKTTGKEFESGYTRDGNTKTQAEIIAYMINKTDESESFANYFKSWRMIPE